MDAIADYVNQQITKRSSSKLETIIKQAALNIDYGLNDFWKHKIFNCNESVRNMQREIEDQKVRKNYFDQSTGMSVPHLNPSEKERESIRLAM